MNSPTTLLDNNFDQQKSDYLMSKSNALQAFNGEVWSTKKANGISLNQPISGIAIPENLAEFNNILTGMHSIE